MQKDFKMGIIIGLFLVVLALIWLAAQPSSSIFARLRNIQQAQADSGSNSGNLSTTSKSSAPSASQSKSSSSPQSPIPSSVIVEEKSKVESATRMADKSADVPGQRFHIVMKGQTLADIARLYYGSTSKWTKIRDANPSINPDKLSPGTRLYIPP